MEDLGMMPDMHHHSNSTCSMSMDMAMSMSMPMYFFFGYQCSLLFRSFNLETPGQLFGGILLIIVVGVLYEGLKTLREVLAGWETKRSTHTSMVDVNVQKNEKSDGHNDKTHLLTTAQASVGVKKPTVVNFLIHVVKGYCSPMHILQSFLNFVQVGVAYILMLVAMTFNGWLFLAVCVGAGLGYFLFGKCRKSYADFRAQSEHCH